MSLICPIFLLREDEATVLLSKRPCKRQTVAASQYLGAGKLSKGGVQIIKMEILDGICHGGGGGRGGAENPSKIPFWLFEPLP